MSRLLSANSPEARDIILGCAYITGSAACFSIILSLVRLLSTELHPFEIAFFRYFFGALFMLPYIARHATAATGAVFRTSRLHVHMVRGALALAATLTWFSALAVLPIAQAVSLNFTVPLFATAGAALILRERVRLRRWTATTVGFLGVLVIIRPGVGDVSWVMALPIVAAAFMATSALTIKSLTRTDSTATIISYQNLLPLPAFFIIALFVWTTPSWQAIGLLALLGLIANLAHLCLTRGFALADASIVMPFDYSRLPFAAGIAFLLFGEVPDPWTWVGAAIIATSAIYIARREALLAAQGKLPDPTPTTLDPKLPT